MPRQPKRMIDRMIALRGRRAELEKRIRDEMSRPSPDGLRLQTLKRLKVRVKDQIVLIKRRLDGSSGPHYPNAA